MTNYMQEIFDGMVAKHRQEELGASPQLLLGEMILKLEAVKNKDLPLFIDQDEKRPMGVDSYRGIYRELAIQTKDLGSYQTEEGEGCYNPIGKENPTVQEWILVLKEAVGKTFTGYKGGDFTMSKNTPVWLSEYGSAYQIYFIDVREESDKVYLVTATESDED